MRRIAGVESVVLDYATRAAANYGLWTSFDCLEFKRTGSITSMVVRNTTMALKVQ